MKQVLDYLLALREERRRKKLVPDSVMFSDLSNAIIRDMRSDLNSLYKKGIISVHKTLNSQSITINELQGTEEEMAQGAPEGDGR